MGTATFYHYLKKNRHLFPLFPTPACARGILSIPQRMKHLRFFSLEGIEESNLMLFFLFVSRVLKKRHSQCLAGKRKRWEQVEKRKLVNIGRGKH